MPLPEQPSYEELAAGNAELLAVVAEQAVLIDTLRAEIAALRRQAGRDSSNSSQPPSQDGPAAGAKARARGRWARPGRPQGGQKGHPGASLACAARPFNWKFTAGDLTELLRRISQREQPPASQPADRPQAA